MSTTFSRIKSDSVVVKNLLNEKLWNEKLKNDCLEGNVFMALRNNYISFYHEGGKLFDYNNNCEFKTHIKHAAVIDIDDKKNDKPSKKKKPVVYITEKELKTAKLIDNFYERYEAVKNNCKPHAMDEEIGLSRLYQKFSYSSKHNSNVVVLDIQVSFSYEEEIIDKINKQDRIDILLLNKKDKKLRFIEAKLASNGDIVADKGRIPAVIDQIDRYRKQIEERKVEIEKAYKKYAETVNKIFEKELLPATNLEVDKQVGLLVFDFSGDIKKGRLDEHVTGNSRYKNAKIPVYCIGKIKDIKADNLWIQTN